ncbi:MAG: hypothetical protein CVU03_03410 [Bacteroidetes bacterium HGW-Bacteroidetes-2]|jgi:hypothetical protein|nr:MAG: hypothetical protein CVU03_03410 [Bacteroidetes bacterium HGW-Bacteroidetes-2]
MTSFFKIKKGFIHQVLIIKINQKMSTLVSIMLAIVMKISSTFTTSSEIITVSPETFSTQTEVIFFEQCLTGTTIKNC